MNSIELSIKDTEEISRQLAVNIAKDFKPDIVVFIARGSYIIGNTISKYFGVPLVEIFAVRRGNKLKDALSPFLKLIPSKIKKCLRKRELKSTIHQKNPDRKVYLGSDSSQLKNADNILIVDDSVDTGNTAKQVYRFIIDNFGDKNVKFACLNVFDGSEKVFKVDYSLYKNYVLIGPWSKDSKFYNEFIKRYNLAKQKGEF